MSDYDIEKLRHRSLSSSNTFEGMVEANLNRRGFLKGAGAAAVTAAAGGALLNIGVPTDAHAVTGFVAVAETTADTVTLPPGYVFNALLTWGDPLFEGDALWGNGAGEINGGNLTAAEQARRVGFNHDMLALFANPFGSPASAGGQPHAAYIAAFNNEYTEPVRMFPGFVAANPTRNQIDTEINASGITVAGIRLVGNVWGQDRTMRVGDVPEGALVARRITGRTRFLLDGPAKDDPRLSGPVDGTFSNCAGGFTPWGTYLSAEENFNFNFANLSGVPAGQTKTTHQIFGMPNGASGTLWERVYDRFDLTKMPNEGFKQGWILELDPYDPTRRPVKHTAIGRVKHECATVVVQYPAGQTKGKVALYSGDDERFDYVYKFVTDGTFDRENPRAKAHFSLLSAGTLYVGKFNADGTGQWLPVTHANVDSLAPGAFADQADICIRTREAADVLGATPMDRPEDVEAPHDPLTFAGTGKVFMVCTNNSNRGGSATAANRANGTVRSSAVDAANPRANNRTGHIVQINEDGNDHTATTFTWQFYLLAGDPKAAAGAVGDVKDSFFGDRFGSPDNITFDNRGLLWIATDGNPASYPCNDQVLCTEIAGNGKVRVKRFLVGPAGCEICGPLFSPDNTTFFCNVQHPGENVASSFPNGTGPRPSMVAVRRADGGIVGT
ncbi:PhoX family phosphatase [Oleomonas cavernae]|uniref:PhoX family phosphatase n=1 Tax=Oleomonas cavernae TaxID=2320859 RepID=A0A418WAI8_9PROT|nr:PhoX family phosphatase [Oleomonas cavernae]RJF86966.1 PhoX family phosphatase [Oleomonas cavernae]